MIQITLINNGKSATYKAAGLTLGTSLEAYDLFRRYGEANGDYTDELLQQCSEFVCKIFGHAFTVRELNDGYKGSAFVLFPSILNAAVSYVDSEIVNFPPPPATAASLDGIAS